jgi:hypothetical protein
MNAKCFCHEGREATKEKAVGQTSEAGDEREEVWVLDIECKKLGG